MNRHFRVPPEHQEFWMEIKTAAKAFWPAIAFFIIVVACTFIAFW